MPVSLPPPAPLSQHHKPDFTLSFGWANPKPASPNENPLVTICDA